MANASLGRPSKDLEILVLRQLGLGLADIVLRSKTPDLVQQEFFGLMMAHFAIRGIMQEAVGGLIDQYLPKHASAADWDLQGLSAALLRDFNVRVEPQVWLQQEFEWEA